MPIVRTPWIDDDGTGTTGTIINNAEKQLLYTQIDEAIGGVWTPVPFNAANFPGTPGITAGQVLLNSVVVLNTYTMLWNLQIGGCPTPSTAGILLLVPGLPAGRSAWHTFAPISVANDAGTERKSYLSVVNATSVNAVRADGTPWSGTGALYLYFSAAIALY